MSQISVLLSGFSIVSVLILLFIYLFFLPDMKKTISGKCACAKTLLCLALIQFAHYLHFTQSLDLLDMRFYCVLLSIIPTSFFFFGREILFPDFRYQWFDIFHLVPVVLSLVMPIYIVPAIAFMFGTGYTFWFASTIFKLKSESRRFKFEIFFFGLFAVMALFALILGLFLPVLDHSIFYHSYSVSISIAILLIIVALLAFPELLSDILLVAELAYAKTKLQGIDTHTMKKKLDTLMTNDKMYENENLNLSMVANALGISPHQLSELINTEFGYSFSRFVREHRITAAKQLLLSDKNASILSISMETGFKSQSNFYTAFKDTVGISPGKFRQE